jgi:hypothetical protein
MRRQKAPDSSGYMQQMMMQDAVRSQQLAQQQAAYSQQLEAQRAKAEADVAAQQAAIDAAAKAKAATPVKLGTILTSNSGLLGNPILSATKLSR